MNEILILEEIKGMRKDINQNLQALQTLFSEYIKSITLNHQLNSKTLEQDDLIKVHTSTNEVVDLDPQIIKSERVENYEKTFEISHNERMHQDEDAFTEGNQDSVPTLENEIVSGSLFQEIYTTPKDYQETKSLLGAKENELTLINGLKENNYVTGINALQLEQTSTSHISRHVNELSSESESVANYFCQICNKRFSSESLLIKHVINSTEGKHNKSGESTNIINHEVVPHSKLYVKERYFKCDYCSKEFKYSNSLKSHLLSHTTEKPFQCKYCPKKFALSCNLKTHIRIHTGEKPFHCTFCPKSFTQSCSLKTHLRTHTGEKPYQCQFCQRTFAHSTGLKSHMKIHFMKEN